MKKFLTQQINFGYAVIVMLALVVGLGSADAALLEYGNEPGNASYPLIHQGGGDEAIVNLQAGGCSGASCTPLGEFDTRGIANGVAYFLGSISGSTFVSLGDTHLLKNVYIGDYNGQLAGPNMTIWSTPQNGLNAPMQVVNVAGNVVSTHLTNSGGNPQVCFTRTGTLVICPQPTATDGACGSSNGGSFTSAPSTNLCSTGTASSVSDNPLTQPRYTWSCFGANGGTTASCSANYQASPINGVCKPYPGSYSSEPATNTSTGCNAGTFQDIDDSGLWDGVTPWRWRCNGQNGGTNALNCTANRVANPSPVCKPYTGNYASQPATNSSNGCDVGTYSDLSDTGSQWRWRCAEGGTNATCSANKDQFDGYSFVCGTDPNGLFGLTQSAPNNSRYSQWTRGTTYSPNNTGDEIPFTMGSMDCYDPITIPFAQANPHSLPNGHDINIPSYNDGADGSVINPNGAGDRLWFKYFCLDGPPSDCFCNTAGAGEQMC